MTPKSVSSIVMQRFYSWSAKLFSWRQSELGEFKSVKNEEDFFQKQKNKRDYQGPLYAPHPDIKKKK